MAANMNSTTCVYLFCLYAPGHLIPMIESAKKLLQCNSSSTNSISIQVLLMQPNDPSMISPICLSYIQSVEQTHHGLPIHFQRLPAIDLPTRFESIEEFVTVCVRLYLPHVKAALLAAPSPVSGLIIDMFATNITDVGNELDIPVYVYFSSTANLLSLALHLAGTQGSKYDQIDFLELGEDICVPGISPIPAISMPAPLLNTKSTSYKALIYHASRIKEAKGIIINSNAHMEGKAIEALVNGVVTELITTPGSSFPDIYPIGPVINFGESSVQEHECLEWLDGQPAKSVVYLCFGSMGGFEASQVGRIATGLEESGHRFLWVLRMPRKNMLSGPTDANLKEILPEGFLERTKGRGMVWHSWAPQITILSHQSIGGFVTHCGWNSIHESLWFGVPMIPWPLYAEQHLNAFFLVNEMHVAVPLNIDRRINNGFVTAGELKRAVKQLMDVDSEDGRRARDRAEEIKLACQNAVKAGGVSDVHLRKLALELGINVDV